MYIHHKTLRVLLQYLNFKSEREFNSKLQIISRLRQKVSVAVKALSGYLAQVSVN